MEWGTIGGRKWEWGGKEEGGGQLTSNLGPEWTEVAPQAKEGFQVSERDSGTGEGFRQKGNYQGDSLRGLCHVLSYNVNPVYIMLLCVCHANKRIVFRL